MNAASKMIRRGAVGACAVALASAACMAACVGADDPLPSTAPADGGGDVIATNQDAAGGDSGCAPGQKLCSGACVPVDPAHGCSAASCVACSADKKWAATCGADTRCACETGYDNCDGDLDNGCERDVRADVNNCGACKNVCGATGTSEAPTCLAAKCVIKCAANRAHCAKVDATGCDTDLMTSPDNCGACGHSCLGGGCEGGLCKPFLIGGNPTQAGLDDLGGLVRVGSNLYGTNYYRTDGLVYRLPTSGKLPDGGLPGLAWIVPANGDPSSDENAATELQSDGTSLFWVIGTSPPEGGIWRSDLNGMNRLKISNASNAATLAVDGTYLYFSIYENGGSKNVQRTLKDGTGLTTFPIGTRISSILADGGKVYVASGGSVFVGDGANLGAATLAAMPVAGEDPLSLAVDATHVYWVSRISTTGYEKLYRTPKPGNINAAATNLTPAGNQTFGGTVTLVDKTSVFTLGESAGRIKRMNKDGSSPLVEIAQISKAACGSLAVPPAGCEDSSYAMVQDDTALYITTAGPRFPVNPPPYAAIWKLAK